MPGGSSKPGPAGEGGRVERIGDALTRLRIRGGISTVGTVGSSNVDLPPEDPPACPRCHDAGFLRRDLPAEHPDFGQIVVCPCRTQDVADRRRSRLERLSNLGPLTRLTFDNLEAEGRSNDPVRRDRYRRIVDRVSAFADTPEGWLLLAGPPGCGKTHLAAAVANRRLADGEAV